MRMIVFAVCLIACTAHAQRPSLTVSVHPGVELLTIVQKLSGKFPPTTPSKYEQDVLNHFGSFMNHPAVTKLKSFTGTVYPDLTELGFCFSDFPEFVLHIPDTTKNWYKLYGRANVVEYLQLCKNFALQTGFWEFYSSHLDEYRRWAATIEQGIIKDSLIEKLNGFYHSQSHPPRFYICMDALNGWGAHAIPNPELFNPAYKDLKAYSIGFFSGKRDSLQEPAFNYGNYATNLVWHEGSHIYLEDLFARYKPQVDALADLFNKDDPGMKSQNISNWEYCLNENVVRGIVIALFKQYKGQRAWKKQNAQEILDDFIYAEEISEFILKKYTNNRKYKTFNEFFPVLLTHLRQLHPLNSLLGR